MNPPTSDLQEEFDRAFELYADAIFRHCSFKIYDRERGKEIAQDTFLRYWQCLVKGEKVENARALLYKICNNLIIDYIRKKKEMSLDELQEKGFEPGEDHLFSLQEKIDGARAIKLLAKVEETYRDVLRLRFVEGLEVWEIADILGEKPNTVSVHIHRGLKQLRSFIDVAE